MNSTSLVLFFGGGLGSAQVKADRRLPGSTAVAHSKLPAVNTKDTGQQVKPGAPGSARVAGAGRGTRSSRSFRSTASSRRRRGTRSRWGSTGVADSQLAEVKITLDSNSTSCARRLSST